MALSLMVTENSLKSNINMAMANSTYLELYWK